MNRGPIIITRPAEDAGSLVAALNDAGIETVLAPLLSMDYLAVTIPNEAYQAVLITSANGCRALERLEGHERLKDVPALAVGPASAAAAKSIGQTHVITSGGDVERLVETTIQNCAADKGPLLYISGKQTSGDLAGQLTAKGFTVTRLVAYEAVAAETLPEDAAKALEGQFASGVALYSPRTARIWIELTNQAGWAGWGAGFVHYCLSDNVQRVIAEAFGTSDAIVTAAQPNEAAMIAAITGKTP